MSKDVDVAIIGTGTAGMVAYKELRKHTDSIALIEGDQYGTTCARVGCMPSKLLIAAAEASHDIEKAFEFGIEVKNKKIDGKLVMKRVKDERDRFVSFVIKDIESFKQEHLYKSKAKFKSSHCLELENGDLINAKVIILAVGSRSNIPDVFKSDSKRVIISDNVFYWNDLPKSVAVIGSGIVGLELGQALSRLGVKTTIFSHSDLIAGLHDPQLQESAREIFAEELDLELSSKITGIEEIDNLIKVSYENKNSEKLEASFEYLLLSAGRKSNLDSLELDKSGLKLNEKQKLSFNPETCQCDDSHIFMAGDAAGYIPLLHEASDEGKIAAKNAIKYLNQEKVEKHKRRSKISIVFSDPQIMSIGASYKELEKSGLNYEFGEVDFKNQGRARSFSVNKGSLRVYGEKGTKKFLGAEMIGPSAEHLAHLLAWSHQSDLTIDELLARPYYHPTIEEGLRTALVDLIKKLA